MARLIGSYECPTWDWEKEQLWLSQLQNDLKSRNTKSDLIGEILQWPRADGYACYIVCSVKPLQIAHLIVGDAWRIEPALSRGVRLSDVRQMVERKRALNKLFNRQ
jgi:hypothetical protein